MIAVVVIIVVAALLVAAGTSTKHDTTTASAGSSSSSSVPPLPDYTTTAGTITSDTVSPGAAGPQATPGLDVRFLSFRDAAQGFGGPQLYVQVVRDTDPGDSTTVAYGESSADAEAVTVDGRAGFLTVLGTVVLLGVPPTADVGEGLLFIGYQLAEPQVLRVAEGMSRAADGTWTATAPPDGLALAASGTDTAPSERDRHIVLSGAVDAELVVRDGDASTFEGLLKDRVETATSVGAASVDGRPAALITIGGATADRRIVWQPTPDSVAELRTTAAATDDTLRSIAAGLRLVPG